MMADLVVEAVEVIVFHPAAAEVDTRVEMRLQGIGVQQVRVKVDTHTILVQTKQILLHWVIILDKGKS
jgi:hypothetical protein